MGDRRTLWILAAALSLLVPLAPPPATGTHVDLAELFELAPWDALHTITEPRFDDEPYVSRTEEVFGVSIGNESHTYPLTLMNWHEVINDVVGGVPIVVAYCPLCGVAMAYERTVEGDVLTFRTSGLLYRNNKVMFDVETSSLWPLLLGEGINGTYHGTPLVRVPAARLPFTDWLSLHPDAKVVARPWGPVLCPFPCPVPPGFSGYDVNPYGGYQLSNDTFAPIGNPDPRLHPKTFVVGVELNGEAWAFAFPDMLEARAINFAVGGVPLVVVLAVDDPASPFPATSAHVYRRGMQAFNVDAETNELVAEGGARYAILTGEGSADSLPPEAFFYGFWFAWRDFHPDTLLYGRESAPFPWHIWGPVLAFVGGALVLTGVALWRRAQRRRGSDT